MKYYLNLIVLLLFGTLLPIEAQSAYYRHIYRKPVTSSARYFMNSNGFMPLSYPIDLYSSETKRSSTSHKPSKKIRLRPFASDEDDFSLEQSQLQPNEYSNESQGFSSRENDSREYTIGTQIRVQHPITVPKKHTSSYTKQTKYHNQSPFKSSAYSEVNLSTESYAPEPSAKKHQSSRYTQSYDSDQFHIIPAPKATAASSTSFSIFDPDTNDDFKPTTSSKSKAELLQRYKNIASKKQIENYLQDQQKFLNEALKIQLLNNPNLKDLLKSANKNKESIEDEFESDPLPNLAPPHRGSFNDNYSYKPARPRRRPAELKRSPKGAKHTGGKPKRKYRSSVVISS